MSMLPAALLQEYYDTIRKEECLIAVEKNASGSRPKELFEDVLEEAEDEHEKTSSVLRDALKENSINITHTSTFEGFQVALQIASNEKVVDIREPNRYMILGILSAAAGKAGTLAPAMPDSLGEEVSCRHCWQPKPLMQLLRCRDQSNAGPDFLHALAFCDIGISSRL